MSEFDNAEQPAEPADVKPTPHIFQTDACKEALPAKLFNDIVRGLSIMRYPISEFNRLVEKYPNINYTETDIGREWAEAVKDASANLVSGNAWGRRVEDPSTEWRQGVDVGGKLLRAGRPALGMGGETRLTGEAAILKATSILGLGAIVQIPLWHSGIWISLKCPQNQALLELDRRLAAEKISLGRLTNGLVFSNVSIYLQSYLVNFVLAHIYDCSIKDINPDRLKNVILCTDIPSMITGLACTIYPSGYPLVQPCISNPDTCQHVTREKINLTKIFWTDNSRLSDWQRTQMSGRNKTFTLDDVEKYQSLHTYNTRITYTPSDDVSVRFKVPTIAQYEEAGFAWVDGIVRMVDDAFGVNLRGAERNAYIEQQSKMTSLRQFGHWVSEITVGDNELVVDDAATINGLLATFSNNEDMTNKIFTAIGDFIDDSTISLIAFPKYECPMCFDGKQKPDEPEVQKEKEAHPHLIPQDAMTLFFTLLDQRISTILSTAK